MRHQMLKKQEHFFVFSKLEALRKNNMAPVFALGYFSLVQFPSPLDYKCLLEASCQVFKTRDNYSIEGYNSVAKGSFILQCEILRCSISKNCVFFVLKTIEDKIRVFN